MTAGPALPFAEFVKAWMPDATAVDIAESLPILRAEYDAVCALIEQRIEAARCLPRAVTTVPAYAVQAARVISVVPLLVGAFWVAVGTACFASLLRFT